MGFWNVYKFGMNLFLFSINCLSFHTQTHTHRHTYSLLSIYPPMSTSPKAEAEAAPAAAAKEDHHKRDTLVEQYSHNEEEHGHIQLQRVVVVSIDPNSAEYVLNWALNNFIQPDQDLVVLVHVRVLDIPMAPYVDSTGYMDDIAEERKEESHDLLKTYASRLWHKQIACKAISMIGDPKAELVRKVKDTHADALIMGSRNLGTIKRTLLGSVSDHCVHHAPCAVIIARSPDDEDKSSRRRSILSRITSSS
ncbi:hypothetical protein BDB00DRAFT_803589 [Zychaea mexicana]|uniref:uncharacterized protein n=1 Tax=Zychaea mexicana TaxID=64656 RepID=UPI0022FF3E08|nr:uncharacterized protein BDB00DRAFT_803589 [Zychaea mexicana]KAI9497678.1 hypothetical protein BDB00DRAFT_803589 [Zychaea mexicana]